MRTFAALVAATVALLTTASAEAKTFEVTRTADTPPNGCNQGGCTLREAVIAANNRPGADTVQLKRGKTYELQQPGSGEDESATGDLDVTGPLAFRNPGDRRAIIDGGGLDGVVDASAGMDLLGVHIRGGSPFGVRTTRSIDVRWSVIRGNDGYGLQTMLPGGPIQLERSRISGNAFQGIQENGEGHISLHRSSITGNHNQGIQQNLGGGITLVRGSSVSNQDFQGIQQYGAGGVRLVQSRVTGNGNQGVQEYDGGAVVVRQGAVSSNGSQGIQTYDDGGLRINRARVSGNDSQGIQAYDEGNVRVIGATIAGNGAQGLVSFGPHRTVIGNTRIRNSFGTGLDASSTDGLDMDRTKITGGSRGVYVGTGVVGVIERSTIADNEGDDGGAGIYVAPTADLTVRASTVKKNTTTGVSGGGILVDAGGLDLTNSTLAGNRAFLSGGGIRVEGVGATAVLNAVTVARNVANYTQASINSGGGGINASGGGTFAVANSLIALNRAPGGVAPDCYANAGSGGNNVFTDTSLCSGLVGSDDEVGNPRIGPLRRNGGPTETIALKSGSPAIGHAGNDAPPRDQRGRKRDKNPDSGASER